MVFAKRYPKDVKGSPYPHWVEVALTDVEETEQELLARKENMSIIRECIEDASVIMKEKNLKPYQTDLVNLAIALFDKRSSHAIFYKEGRTKEKFDQLIANGTIK